MRVDYLIVGAGASGCAVARRLSEDRSVTVLLLDAGPSRATLATAIPRAFPLALREPWLASYPTRSPQADSTSGYWVRGRGVGGSTLVNGMMYLRGEPASYDDLETIAGSGWGWSAFESAFGELERLLRPSLSTLDPLAETIVDSIAAYGARVVTDLNATAGPRVGATPATIRNGVRQDAAKALLPPRRTRTRTNLHVLPETEAGSLIWQGNRVTGVRARRGGATRDILAETVVLCCGTIETALLLERSGVGRADLLSAAGIQTRVESPRVGEGVREQRGHGLQLRLRPDAGGVGAAYWAQQAATYAVTRSGALARPAYDVTGLLTTGNEAAGLQVMGVPFGLHPGGSLRPAQHPSVFLCAYPTRPTSTWSIHLDAHDLHTAAVITPPAQRTEADRRAASEATSALAAIATSGPLADISLGPDSDAPTGVGESIYHAVGSAAMGTADDAVTDPDLRVRGTQGLRVADLSILPFHPSGSTAAPAMAIGWLAAQRIRDSAD